MKMATKRPAPVPAAPEPIGKATARAIGKFNTVLGIDAAIAAIKELIKKARKEKQCREALLAFLNRILEELNRGPAHGDDLSSPDGPPTGKTAAGAIKEFNDAVAVSAAIAVIEKLLQLARKEPKQCREVLVAFLTQALGEVKRGGGQGDGLGTQDGPPGT